MKTSTASRLLSIRLFVKIYGPGLPNKLWQPTVSRHKRSALLCQIWSHSPSQCQLFFPTPFFLIPVMFLLIQSHGCIQDPFLALHSCFSPSKSSIALVSHHLLPQILPCYLSLHPSFTANSIPLLPPCALSFLCCYSFCIGTKQLLVGQWMVQSTEKKELCWTPVLL